MTVQEWMTGISAETVAEIKFHGTVDGVENVVIVSGRVKKPVPNGFNSWKWMIPLEADGQLTGGDNPYVFVWGPDWFEYVNDYHQQEA